MRAYLDTSIVAVGMLHDPGVGKLKRWLRDVPRSIFWSDFARGELVSAIAVRMRLKTLDHDAAQAIVSAIVPSTREWGYEEVQPSDIADATDLVGRFDLNLKLPDAIHIAIARRMECTLVSADRTQLAAASALGIAVSDPLEVQWSNL